MQPIGNFRDCDFYIADGEDRSGFAFRMAYKTAKQSRNNKELCASWGSMMCVISAGRLRVPVNLALNRISVRPREVKLPSEAGNYNISITEVPEMEWPSILITFACCTLLLFQNNCADEKIYTIYMSNCIRELQKRLGHDPESADLDVPFDFKTAEVIRSMLGVTLTLRESAMEYMIDMSNIIDSEDSGIGLVCQYLCSLLSWSGRMEELNIVTEILVKPESPVLNDPRVAKEVCYLNEAREAVRSHHPHSQFFKHMASDAELMKVDSSRFPTLVAVAQELGGIGYKGKENAGREFLKTLSDLMTLHYRANELKAHAQTVSDLVAIYYEENEAQS